MRDLTTEENLDKVRHAVRRAGYPGQDFPASAVDVLEVVETTLEQMGLEPTKPDRDHPLERHIAAQILGDVAARQLPSALREQILDRLEHAGLTTRRADDELDAPLFDPTREGAVLNYYLHEHPSPIGALREVVTLLDSVVERVARVLEQE